MFTKMKLNSLIKKVKSLYNKREGGANVNVKHEIKALMNLADFYLKHKNDASIPRAETLAYEYYRAAANLGSTKAQFVFAKHRLDEGIFWQQLHEDMYGREIHKTYAKNCFEEAFNYFEQAIQTGSPLAKRWYGMAYIHGWGVIPDKDKGFQLIVQSIEEEDAWGKATEIFEKLGLNTPEFFSSIMAAKNSKKS